MTHKVGGRLEENKEMQVSRRVVNSAKVQVLKTHPMNTLTKAPPELYFHPGSRPPPRLPLAIKQSVHHPRSSKV